MDILDTIDNVRLPKVKRPASSFRSGMGHTVLSWLLAWEVYPIILLAAFLRFYQFSTTEFDADQAIIFSLARNAIVHGLVPVTTNISSIRTLNPPATVYLLMLGAVFSANPFAGVIVTGILNVLAVLFTYIVVRRYYGRFAGTVAGLFYAVAQLAVFYSGFLWNQNLLAPFIPLFLFALLWGVIERRRGWLVPAVVLWGWMIQLHGSAVLLIIPLGLACILAFKTLRWRDVFLAVALLVLIYSPYIAWEFTSHFSDLPVLLKNMGGHAVIDTKALHAYLDFLNPAVFRVTDPLNWQYKLNPLFQWGYRGMLALTACAFGFAVFAVCQSRWKLLRFVPRGERLPARLAGNATTPEREIRAWWADLVATPQRCGLLILLAWQILPVMYLSRHSLLMFDYYLLVLMPGPFILIGIFSAQISTWLRSLRFPWPLARIAFSLLLIVLAFTLSLGSFTSNFGRSGGGTNISYAYYTLHDMQNALEESDHLADVYHAHHVYISLDFYTSDALTYLAGQMQTPHTTYQASNCLPLPGLAQGPALMLFGPADASAETLLTHIAGARLVSEPSRMDGPPFHLYLVQPVASSLSSISFLNNLAPAAGPAQFFASANASSQILTRWTVLHAAVPAYGTTYTYKLDASFHGNGTDGSTTEDTCSLSDLQPGEQLLAAFGLPTGSTTAPASLSLTGTTWTTTPYSPAYGPIHLETFLSQSAPEAPLQPSDGGTNLALQG